MAVPPAGLTDQGVRYVDACLGFTSRRSGRVHRWADLPDDPWDLDPGAGRDPAGAASEDAM